MTEIKSQHPANYKVIHADYSKVGQGREKWGRYVKQGKVRLGKAIVCQTKNHL